MENEIRKDRFIWKPGDVTITPPSKEEQAVNNNIFGSEAEKQGDIDQAIELYEENVRARFQGNHPYDRLAIIYHKQKRYEDEKRVLKTAIDVFAHDVYKGRADRLPKLQKFKDRLQKLKDKGLI